MHAKRFFILPIVALSVIAGLAFYFTEKNFQKEKNSGAIVKYANAMYGISFMYPKDYLLEEKEIGDAHRYHHQIILFENTETYKNLREGKLSATEAPPAIRIDIFQNNLEKLAPLDWAKNHSESNFKLSDGKYGMIKIAGLPAVSYTWDGLYRGDNIVFSHEENILMLSGEYISSDDAIKKDFSLITDTFKVN